MKFSLSQPCFLCGDNCNTTSCLCQSCMDELPYMTHTCFQCGLPIEGTVSKNTVCGACITNPPPVTQCISVLNYESPVDFLVKHMKYHNQLAIAELLGQLLIEKIIAQSKNKALPDTIIPVPLHRDRLKKRGYNQALEIAKPISQALNIPINLHDCTRIKSTAPQFDLPAAKRSDNIKHAFSVSSTLNSKHVALVDDVITTGSTVWEIANNLLKTGVKRVDVWSCARATTR